jgi:hypothetical protein
MILLTLNEEFKMDELVRALKAALEELHKPKTYVKGDEFEHYVREHLFTKERYDLVHQTHDYKANKNDFVETSKEPDFKFRSRRSGRKFLVEVKYRSALYQGTVEWCKPYQLKRYKAIAKAMPVLVAIGLGGLPESPEHVYIVPIKHIRYTRLFPSFLKHYEVPADQCADADRILLSLQHSTRGLGPNARTIKPFRYSAMQH